MMFIPHYSILSSDISIENQLEKDDFATFIDLKGNLVWRTISLTLVIFTLSIARFSNRFSIANCFKFNVLVQYFAWKL